jgi:predicted transcriptional regulator YdeE/2-polyprenyl-3-methyl-5-hydroxy-6-metoxy-1,4-benzoquinol methylase
MEPRIALFPATKIAGLRQTMSFAKNTTGTLWQAFMPRRAEITNRSDAHFYSLEVYSDPDFFKTFDPSKSFEKWAGVAVNNVDLLPAGMESLVIPAGLYAVFTYRGQPADAAGFYQSIYSGWLPSSDYWLDQRPHFALMGEKYKPGSVDSEEEIFIPVRPKKENNEFKTSIAVEIFDRFANPYAEKFMDVSAYAKALDLFCGSLTDQASVLDVACGPGNVAQYLLAKKPGLKIHCTDLSPKMLELAKQHNPSATFELMDCRNISSTGLKFDAICCSFAFPYLSKDEVMKWISDAGKMLAAGGSVYISTMEDNYSRSGWETSPAGNTAYMHYHEAGYLEEALKANNFALKHLHRQDFLKPNGTKMIDLLLVAVKN